MHKYEVVHQHLAKMVEGMEVGQRIPTEKELAKRFDVSPMTVRRALQILLDQGALRGVPGKGTFVVKPRLIKSVQVTDSFSEAIRSFGKTPGSKLISAALRNPTAAEAEFFQMDASGFVVAVHRTRTSDGVPIGIEHAVLNADLLPGLLGFDLSQSLYSIIENEYDISIVRTAILVSASLPSADEADMLHIDPSMPCLQVHVTATTENSEPLEYTHSLFRGDMYEMKI